MDRAIISKVYIFSVRTCVTQICIRKFRYNACVVPTHIKSEGNFRINALRESLQDSLHHIRKIKKPDICSTTTASSANKLLLIDKENKAAILLNKTNCTCSWNILFSCDSILLTGLLTTHTLSLKRANHIWPLLLYQLNLKRAKVTNTLFCFIFSNQFQQIFQMATR